MKREGTRTNRIKVLVLLSAESVKRVVPSGDLLAKVRLLQSRTNAGVSSPYYIFEITVVGCLS